MVLRARFGAVQIGPGSRDQRSGPVRQLQGQLITAVAVKMSENAQRLSLQRMTVAQDRYRGREVAEVGSVWWFPSTT